MSLSFETGHTIQAVRYVTGTRYHTPQTAVFLPTTPAMKNDDKTFPCGAGAIQITKTVCYFFC